MTDKVQKILNEITVRKLCTMDEHMAFYNDKAKEDYRFLSEIEEVIKALQEKPVSDELEKVVEEIVDPTVLNAYGVKDIANRLRRTMIENVSEELEEACEQLAENARKHKAETSSPFFSQTDYKQGVMDGAQWQKGNLWKPADGEDLPEYEREVVVFTQNFPNDAGIMMVAIAHRPDPKGWDGKSITTGKVEHYTPKTYGKGGWNIPDVIFWLDVDISKLKED